MENKATEAHNTGRDFKVMRTFMPYTPLGSHQLNRSLYTLRFSQMGCNTSSSTAVLDPSEKPEERLETATSPKEASTEETTKKEKKRKTECHQLILFPK